MYALSISYKSLLGLVLAGHLAAGLPQGSSSSASITSTVSVPPIGTITPDIISIAGDGPPVSSVPIKLTEAGVSAIQLLLFLEELEVALYYNGFENMTSGKWDMSGLPNDTAQIVEKTAAQEDIHVATLTGLLEANNATVINRCNYSFTADNAIDFLAIANVITPSNYGSIMGVQNELGASDTSILLSSSAILATEVTHETFIRMAVNEIPNPAAFETGIPPSWGYNIGFQYTVPGTCPGGINYPLYPPLYLAGQPKPAFANSTAPTTLSLEWDADQYWAKMETGAKQLYICWLNLANGPVYTDLTVTGSGTGTTQVPKGLQNIAWIAITADQPVSLIDVGGATLAGPLAVPIS